MGAGKGARVAAEVATWVGTPMRWQQSAKGQGCDCKGLVVGAARELGLPEAESPFAAMVDYRRDRKVDTALLRRGLMATFDKVEGAPEAGDVLLLRHGGRAQHLAVVTAFDPATGDGLVVHAQIAPADRVKEARLGALTALCPIDSIWRWREEGAGDGR